MCSQHILKRFTHFFTCIHLSKVFAACMHSTAAATLSYSTSLSMCAKELWHCGHYVLSYLTHNDLPEEGELEKQPQMENTSQSMWWMTSFIFSCGCFHTCPTLCDESRQHHTIHRVTEMCVLDFYWTATDPSDMETKEHNSAFVQMQLPSRDFANHEHKDMFHCCCLSCSKECSQQRLWIYLDSLAASHGTTR